MNLLFCLFVILLVGVSFADEQWSSYENAMAEKDKILAMVINNLI